MDSKILSGKEVSRHIKQKLAEQTALFTSKTHRKPGVGIILCGNNPASEVYVRNKLKTAEKLGFQSFFEHFGPDKNKLFETIEHFNKHPEIDGYIIQLPLPRELHLDENQILEMIDPSKDADGFHPFNLGKVLNESGDIFPATPAGILEILKYYQIPTEGKHVVITGRSTIVGKPMALLMMRKNNPGNASVTLIHSRIKEPEKYIRQADIFISSVGIPKLWNSRHIAPGTIVIDVGINRDENGKLCGDVDFEDVYPIVQAITPVPGGVGPMTVSMLLSNVLKLAQKREGFI